MPSEQQKRWQILYRLSGGSVAHCIQYIGTLSNFLGNSLISAIPPALSAIGPNASMASCIAVVAIIPAAAMATPVKSGQEVRNKNTRT